MSVIQLPRNLILLRPREAAGARIVQPRPVKRAVTGREALLERLATIGDVAPGAPLSFLVVRVAGESASETELARAATMEMVGARVLALSRPTDVVGRLTRDSLGVVLQGSGATAAGAVASRLGHHLAALVEILEPGLGVTVSAATGTGVNAATLPAAAMASFPECG